MVLLLIIAMSFVVLIYALRQGRAVKVAFRTLLVDFSPPNAPCARISLHKTTQSYQQVHSVHSRRGRGREGPRREAGRKPKLTRAAERLRPEADRRRPGREDVARPEREQDGPLL